MGGPKQYPGNMQQSRTTGGRPSSKHVDDFNKLAAAKTDRPTEITPPTTLPPNNNPLPQENVRTNSLNLQTPPKITEEFNSVASAGVKVRLKTYFFLLTHMAISM